MAHKNKKVKQEYMRNSHANSISKEEIQNNIVAKYDIFSDLDISKVKSQIMGTESEENITDDSLKINSLFPNICQKWQKKKYNGG